MKYEECVSILDKEARASGDLAHIELRSAYPNPSDQEWDECLQEVLDGGEDLANPYHCIGRYELRLSERGVPTVLATIGRDLEVLARNCGVPDLMLYEGISKK